MKKIVLAAIGWVVAVSLAVAEDAIKVADNANRYLDEDIRLVSEDVSISNSKIKVTYRFLNGSQKDISTTNGYGYTPGTVEGRAFTVAFNGEPVDPNAPGLTHVFPAGKEIEITKEYIPDVTRHVQDRIPDDGCPDEGSQKGVDRLMLENKKRGITTHVIAEEIQYPFITESVLTREVAQFRLYLDKGATNRMISLCFPGRGKKLSPTEFVFIQPNYLPKGKLVVYFVEVAEGHQIDAPAPVENGKVTKPAAPQASTGSSAEKRIESQSMQEVAKKLNCLACHATQLRVVGPAWLEVAARYKGATHFDYEGKEYPLEEGLMLTISRGGLGHWGQLPMPAIDPRQTAQPEIRELVRSILDLAN